MSTAADEGPRLRLIVLWSFEGLVSYDLPPQVDSSNFLHSSEPIRALIQPKALALAEISISKDFTAWGYQKLVS